MADLHDLKKREAELTKQIQAARDARRKARGIDVPEGGGRKALVHLLRKLKAYIAEKVKNRKLVRKRIRHQARPDKPTKGIDVSGNNGAVDWQKVRAEGYDFAFAKATEGTGWTDPSFSSARLKAMKDAGLRVGAYHFARPDTGGSTNDARQEAQDFVQAVKSRGGHFISIKDWVAGKDGVLGALDFETAPYSAAWAAAFADEFQKQTGVNLIIYGGGYSLNPVLSAIDKFAAVWLAAYVNDWHGYYNGKDSDVVIWQFTASGHSSATSGALDVDRYIG